MLHTKIFEAKSTHPKVCQGRRSSGQMKATNTATFQFQQKLLVLWVNVFWDHIFAICQYGKVLFCSELLTVVKWKKATAGMCFCINDDKNLSLFLSIFIWSSKRGCWEINKKLIWFMDTMLKSVTKYQDDTHNSHWNLVCLGAPDEYIFSALHLCGTNQNKF